MRLIRTTQKPQMIAFAYGLILFLHVGQANMFSVLMPSIMTDLNVSAAQMSIAPTAAMGFSLIILAIGVKVIDILTPKICILIGSIGMLAMGIIYANTSSLLFIIVGSCVHSLTMSLGYHAVAVAGISPYYEPAKLTRVTGIIYGIANFGGSFVVIVTSSLVETIGWKHCYLYITSVIFIICVLCNLLMIPYKRRRETSSDTEIVRDEPIVAEGLTLPEVRKTGSFYLLCIGTFLGLSCSITIANISLHFASNGLNPGTYGKYQTVLLIAGGVLTICSGWIFTKFGPKLGICVFVATYVMGMVLIILWTSVQSGVLALLSVVLIGFSRCVFATPMMLIVYLFGKRSVSQIAPIVTLFGNMAYMVWQVITARIYDVAGGSYIPSLILLAVLAASSGVMFLLALHHSPMKAAEMSTI